MWQKYIGQRGRSFHARFHEHFRDYKYANNKSKFAQHLLEGNSFGPVEDITDTIHIANKGRMLDTLERFYIYRETQRDNQINDKLTVKSNAIFEALVQNDPHRAHATSSNHPAHT
jgi:tRNA U38,U39,U40 pseudouridine synthase TruA